MDDAGRGCLPVSGLVVGVMYQPDMFERLAVTYFAATPEQYFSLWRRLLDRARIAPGARASKQEVSGAMEPRTLASRKILRLPDGSQPRERATAKSCQTTRRRGHGMGKVRIGAHGEAKGKGSNLG